MYRINTTTHKSSINGKGEVNKTLKKQSTDTLYLMQNENEILKMKNNQLAAKVKALKLQLHERTERISLAELDCKALRDSVNKTYFTKDIELQNEKNILLDKIALEKNNIEIYHNKIDDARHAVINEEEKIKMLISDKHGFEEQLRICKMQNEGSKSILINLEDENQRLREKNSKLSLKKYSYEPDEKVISEEIESRIRLIKSINSNQRIFTKSMSSKIVLKLFQTISFRVKKQTYLMIEMHGLKKAITKKKIFLLSCIRKKYVNYIKTRVLAAFRQNFKPLEQERKFFKLLADIKKRRQKAKIWRIWRNQTAKAEYHLIRKFEFQNTLQKICQSYTKSTLFNVFTKLKYHLNSHQVQIACGKIHSAMSFAIKRHLNQFMCIAKRSTEQNEIDKEIQQSAMEHSKLLGIGRYFHEWATVVRINRTVNLNLKFKYFKELKKLIALKNKNVLNEMLGITKQKIRNVEILSSCFNALGKQRVNNKILTLQGEENKFTTKLTDMLEDTADMHQFNKLSDRNLSLLKISEYLKKKSQQAFKIWRNENRKIFQLDRIIKLILLKMFENINFSFSRLQRHRFSKLKLSIKEKISSCEYSYNYLLDQNKHIKGILQKKSHELEKAKFVSILQRIIRKEKQIKHIYLYRFLRNSYKYWKVKKAYQRIDAFVEKKIKIVFMFLLEFNAKESRQQDRINYFTNQHDTNEEKKLIKISFNVFKEQVQRNKRLKRALAGVFDRNLQINFYQAFAKLSSQAHLFQINETTYVQEQIQTKIQTINTEILEATDSINTFTERLKQKEYTFKQRKTMSIYKFFSKNIQKNVGQYIKRWKNKVDQEKRIIKFVELLDSRAKSITKIKLSLAFQKTKGQLQTKSLEDRLERFKYQYEQAVSGYDQFVIEADQKSLKMKVQNEQNQKIAQLYETKTQHMDEVKITTFIRNCNKRLRQNIFIQWKNQRSKFIQKWQKLFEILRIQILRQSMEIMNGEIKAEIKIDRIKNNLTRIYHKSYMHNVGLGFRIWRFTNIINKVHQNDGQLKQAMKIMENLQIYHAKVYNKYDEEVNYRINRHKLRKITNSWRIYTQMKLQNNCKEEKLINWLRTGYSVDCIKVLQRNKSKFILLKKRISDFQLKFVQSKTKAFLKYLYNIQRRKNTIRNLFMKKFCFYQINQIYEEFFARTKNYYRENEVKKTDRKCYCIQKAIQTFQKKRKDILTQNMRKWRRNQYLMIMQKALMKRLTRNAMNSRLRDLFYAWKLEREARYMLYENTQEGEIKKRKVEIKRLMKFLDQYKKEKGLLLENEQGNFVVSPKFQENKEKQSKRQKILKYQFISRLILSMNGYQAPIKAWNNLQIYMKLRKQYKKAALMTKNRLQEPDLYTSFKIWHNATKDLRKMFENMQRKDLIKILNKQKDKMQIEYSKKVEVQEKVQNQLRRYKILSYQQKRKQRICSQILFKAARKVKAFAFDAWRKRVQQMKDYQAHDLQDRGGTKVLNMQQQLHELQARQAQLQEHNVMLRVAVGQALQLAEMIKRISQERDELRRELSENDISCENLLEQNEELNNKLILAQKQALNLLSLSGNVAR